jgi:uncharacterized C2H2 Zn-finger protein
MFALAPSFATAAVDKPATETSKPTAAEAPTKKAKCKKCKGAFESKKDVVAHAIKEHKAKGCEACAKIFRSKKQIVKHAVGAHEKKFCKSCRTLFDSDKEKVEDAIKNHGKKGCVACATLFKNAAAASEHEKMHAAKDGK